MCRILGLLIIGVLLSCNSSQKKIEIKKEPVMYKPSEMALLMRKMYEVNKILKDQIVRNDTLLPFPDDFLMIHSAVLTDPSDRDIEFDSLAKQFLKYQKSTFSSRADSVVYHYNQSINTCIACHETRCTGPIPKIKKLLIH